MKLNKMMYYFFNFRKLISFFIFLIGLTCYGLGSLNSQELFEKEMRIDSSTKFDDKISEFPSNPLKIVDMIRRMNSLNDATKPSDAIDNALESFIMIDEMEKL